MSRQQKLLNLLAEVVSKKNKFKNHIVAVAGVAADVKADVDNISFRINSKLTTMGIKSVGEELVEVSFGNRFASGYSIQVGHCESDVVILIQGLSYFVGGCQLVRTIGLLSRFLNFVGLFHKRHLSSERIF